MGVFVVCGVGGGMRTEKRARVVERMEWIPGWMERDGKCVHRVYKSHAVPATPPAAVKLARRTDATYHATPWTGLNGRTTSGTMPSHSAPFQLCDLIGFGTNILAIQMTFLPLEYIGFSGGVPACGFSLGWQGIIPANAAKIADKAVTIMTTQLISVDEVFAKLDPKTIAELTRDSLRAALERVVEKVAVQHCHDVWESLPLLARAELVDKAAELAEPSIAKLVETLRERVHEVLDLKAMATEKLLEDKALMNEVFKRCGEAEFRFIERSGLYFGFLLGIIQAFVWWLLLNFRNTYLADNPSALPLWWFLPTAGALCGYITNALALGVIFNPIEPVHCCGCVIHGLFLQRQREVSHEFATIVAAQVVTASNCWENILYGSPRQGEVLVEMVTKIVCRSIDEQVGLLRPLVPLLVGSARFHQAKLQAAALLIEELPLILRATYRYTEEQMDMQNLLRTRMQALASAKFERVLHPAFEEDEWKLIGVGGLLGLAVGVFQLAFVFGDMV